MFAWLRKVFRLHVWVYRNPYNRTCSTCGCHEVQHHMAGNSKVWWWESFSDGNPERHKKGGEA